MCKATLRGSDKQARFAVKQQTRGLEVGPRNPCRYASLALKKVKQYDCVVARSRSDAITWRPREVGEVTKPSWYARQHDKVDLTLVNLHLDSFEWLQCLLVAQSTIVEKRLARFDGVLLRVLIQKVVVFKSQQEPDDLVDFASRDAWCCCNLLQVGDNLQNVSLYKIFYRVANV